jgi:hypothetical protein
LFSDWIGFTTKHFCLKQTWKDFSEKSNLKFNRAWREHLSRYDIHLLLSRDKYCVTINISLLKQCKRPRCMTSSFWFHIHSYYKTNQFSQQFKWYCTNCFQIFGPKMPVSVDAELNDDLKSLPPPLVPQSVLPIFDLSESSPGHLSFLLYYFLGY